MDPSSEDVDIAARVASPPPTYDESANDPVLSVLTERVFGGPESQVFNPGTSRSTPIVSPDRSGISQPPIQPSSPSQTITIPSSDVTRTTSSSQASSSSPNRPSAVQPLPVREEVVLTYQPDLVELRRPSGLERYYFSPSGPYSMVLLPSLTADDSRPLYHISWRQDYFSPLSVVTTIRKGATEGGEFVAEFGLGAMRLRGEDETLIKDKLKLEPWHETGWTWSHNGVKHIWIPKKKQPGNIPYYQCGALTQDGQEIIAIMRPANYKELGVSRTSQLKMYPKGYDYFDEILLCALILSRHYPEKNLMDTFLQETLRRANLNVRGLFDIVKNAVSKAGVPS